MAASVRDDIVALLPRLRRFCFALTGNHDEGDDLLQMTVERSLARIDQWQIGSRLDSWMYRIAQNAHIDLMRRRKHQGHEVGLEALELVSGSDGRAIVEARSDLARVQGALAALPVEQRALVAMVIVDGQSYKEASVTFDIPIGTVMSRIARARAAICAKLDLGPLCESEA